MALTDAQKLEVRQRHGLIEDSDAENYITDFKVYRYKDGIEYSKANINIDYLVESFDGSTMGVFSQRSPLEIVTYGISSLKDENNVWVEWTGGEE